MQLGEHKGQQNRVCKYKPVVAEAVDQAFPEE